MKSVINFIISSILIFWSNWYFDQSHKNFFLVHNKWDAKSPNWVVVGEVEGVSSIWLIYLSIFKFDFFINFYWKMFIILSIFWLIFYSKHIDILIKLLLLSFWYFYQNLIIISKTSFSVPLKCNFAHLFGSVVT